MKSAKCLDKERSMIKGKRMTGSCFRVPERVISKNPEQKKAERRSGKESQKCLKEQSQGRRKKLEDTGDRMAGTEGMWTR